MRVAEAIDCGAIPIVTCGTSYFANYFPSTLMRTFIDVGDLSHLIPARVAKPWRRLGASTSTSAMVCGRAGGSGCLASARAAEEAVALLDSLANDEPRLLERREAMVAAWEAWDWTGEIARRMGRLHGQIL